MQNIKEIEILNPLHTGFYGYSILNPSEEGNGIEDSEIYNTLNEFNISEKEDIYIEYNYKKYQIEVSSQVNDYFINLINEIIYDLFDIEDLLSKKLSEVLVSPKYYNFETDRSFMTVCFNTLKFNQFIDKVYNTYYDELKTYIKDHFTSYDGFMSFYSPDIKEWKAKNYDLDHNELSSIFQVLINVYDYKDSEDILNDLYEIASEVFYNMGSYYVWEYNHETIKLDYYDFEIISDNPDHRDQILTYLINNPDPENITGWD